MAGMRLPKQNSMTYKQLLRVTFRFRFVCLICGCVGEAKIFLYFGNSGMSESQDMRHLRPI